tara:strand:+ start:172 stop:345 length:174 start_codon:yes stop_codon:yes gene_type:complete
MNGKPAELAETADEVGQAKQIVDLVKENKMMTALVVFVLWQTGTLLELYSQLQGGMC